MKSILSVQWYYGNVVLVDTLVERAHTITPNKARELAWGLLIAADKADLCMPVEPR